MGALTNFLIVVAVIAFSIVLFPAPGNPTYDTSANTTVNIQNDITSMQNQLNSIRDNGVFSVQGAFGLIVLPVGAINIFANSLILIPSTMINVLQIPVIGTMLTAVFVLFLLIAGISWFFQRNEP